MTQTIQIKNPLISYCVREDGWVVVLATGDGGGNVELLFDDGDLAGSASLGLMGVTNLLDLIHDEGVEAGFDWCNANKAERITNAELEAFLKGE